MSFMALIVAARNRSCHGVGTMAAHGRPREPVTWDAAYSSVV